MSRLLQAFALGVSFALAADDVTLEIAKGSLTNDDECFEGDEQCALNALQLRQTELDDAADDGRIGLGPDPNSTELGSGYHQSVPDGYLAARCSHRSYCIMGRPAPYMVVAGHSDSIGMESINGGNVGYYDSMMNAAWSRCGSSSCVIITNPKGFRTQSRFHIHYRYQSGHGKSLKAKMEHKVCHGGGWQHGGFPCGGKAKFFSGHVAPMSAAMGAGGIHGAGVSVWPQACGGGGAIVLVTYHCSIEHSIANIPPH
ncbi:unnamed protein product [Effrenium voratum]|nr:unnamed protein product [Effrenium voratum]